MIENLRKNEKQNDALFETTTNIINSILQNDICFQFLSNQLLQELSVKINEEDQKSGQDKSNITWSSPTKFWSTHFNQTMKTGKEIILMTKERILCF